LVWKDTWLYSEPLSTTSPDLFKLCEQKDISVFQLVTGLVPITFSRWLINDLRNEWNKILTDVLNVQLESESDTICWKLEGNGVFSVQSTYNALTCSDSGPYYKNIWKGKIPPKIKIFLWLVANDAILTKDDMLKRKWQGDPLCYFCHLPETVTHLFFYMFYC
jgi:hypothetical protein